MTDSIAKLAETINRRMHTVSSGKIGTIAEVGNIVSNGALEVASLDGKIPRSQYSVLNQKVYSSGDTVLVIWADEEPVVIGRLD